MRQGMTSAIPACIRRASRHDICHALVPCTFAVGAPCIGGYHLPCICHVSAMHLPCACHASGDGACYASTMHCCHVFLPCICHASGGDIRHVSAVYLTCDCHASAVHREQSQLQAPAMHQIITSAMHLLCMCHASAIAYSCKHLLCTCQACHRGKFYTTPGTTNYNVTTPTGHGV